MFLIHHYALLLISILKVLLTHSAALQDAFPAALPLDTQAPQLSAPEVYNEIVDIDIARIPRAGDLLTTNILPQKIVCHIPSRAVTRTTFNECRAIFRAFTNGIKGPGYRQIQRFSWKQQPRYPHTPPYRVNVAHNNCEFNITLANEYIVSEFSFEQAKQLGQTVIQQCEDAGHYYGGFAPLIPGWDHGWRVEIGGVPEWRRYRAGVPTVDSAELSRTTRRETVRAVAISREVQPRDKNNNAQRSLSPLINSTTPLNVQFHCFQPLPPLVRLSFDQCRPVFRRLATFVTGPSYRQVQPFTWHYRPTHPYPPPYHFKSPGSRCTLNITLSDTHAIAAFSFEQAKDLAQRVVQSCQDQGRNYGGFALLDSEDYRGWRVEVGAIEGKISQERMEPMNIDRALRVEEEPQEFVGRLQDSIIDPTPQSSRLDLGSDIGIASTGGRASFTEPLKVRADVLPHGPVQCRHNSPSSMTITFASCSPVFQALITMAGDQYTNVKRFSWHYLPEHPHPPPYAITTNSSPCELIITTHDIRQVAQFSFRQANILAQNVLRECEFQGHFYGGTASIVRLENTGWEVEIRKRTKWDTQTHELEWQNETTAVELTKMDKREMSVDAPNLALTINATNDSVNTLIYGPIQCYHPSSDRSRTSFAECRNTFRNIAGYFGTHYRLVQSFYWHQTPQYPHSPPYRFFVLGENCELNITTEDRSQLGRFSFEQTKMLGQDIMEECTRGGYSYGGYAPIVAENFRGWRVEVGGRTGVGSSEIDVVAKVFRRGSLPRRSPLSSPSTRYDSGAKLSPGKVGDLEEQGPVVERAIAPSSPQPDAGMIWCYPPSQWHPPVLFSECRKIFRALPDIMSAHQWITKQRFFAHRSPRSPQHPPPFNWRFIDVDCVFNLTTTDPSIIEEFSFMEAKQLAQDVLQECEDRHQYRGGFATLFRDKPRGWRVEIGGKHPFQPLPGLAPNFSIARRSPAPAVDAYTDQLEESISTPSQLPSPPLFSSPPRPRLPRVFCYQPHPDKHRTTFAECRKVFRMLPTLMEGWRYRRVQSWVRGYSPHLRRVQGFPPFGFGAPGSNCKFSITVIDRRIEGFFSFEQAKNLAQDVLQECEERGLYLGGNALMVPEQGLGWRVEILGKPEPEPPGGELVLGEAEAGVPMVNETAIEKD
ncbi:MAG: hypothetical protein LQ342_006350 [Letrouitia transgressa]|nr:MAG: hypothetical protein LQ342_006350 [Letrouitia transgressa]